MRLEDHDEDANDSHNNGGKKGEHVEGKPAPASIYFAMVRFGFGGGQRRAQFAKGYPAAFFDDAVFVERVIQRRTIDTGEDSECEQQDSKPDHRLKILHYFVAIYEKPAGRAPGAAGPGAGKGDRSCGAQPKFVGCVTQNR
jgi:hypothetical protein